jgi:hypothetical protein
MAEEDMDDEKVSDGSGGRLHSTPAADAPGG